jgi:lysophospholipase L1-like esterase
MKSLRVYYYLIVFIMTGSGVLPLGGCAKNKAVGSVAAGSGRPADTSMRQQVKDTGQLSWLALGDSYTIGQSVEDSERYAVQAAGLLRGGGVNMKDPEIIAVTGWTTQNLLDAIKGEGEPPLLTTPGRATHPWRMKKTASPPYGIVSLLIGVNNQYQGRSLAAYRIQFTSLLLQSIQLAGNRPGRVIVLSIPDYSVTPFAAGLDRAAIARDIDAFNAANREISDHNKVLWLDVTSSSRLAANDRALIAADGLHFSGREYRNWALMLAPVVKQALQ